MPSIHLPILNMALDAFSLVIMLIIHAACIKEYLKKKIGSKYFLSLQASVIIALIADMVGWIGEGRVSLSWMTLIANTVAASACQIVILSFMGYLIDSLYAHSRVSACLMNIFRVLCVFSLLYYIGNAIFGYAFVVNEEGHYVCLADKGLELLSLVFPALAFFAVVGMALFAQKSARVNRFSFILYTIFPLCGLILDAIFHGISMTYPGFCVSVLVIYSGIYLTKEKQLEGQRNALMLSQINPHFVHNTLSTIAAMCDTSPRQAKALTIDFSRYLRNNIATLTAEALIPFEQEMDHVECYLKIEQARFRERMRVIYSIQCKDFYVPPLTVQPLVENAVKHGITKKAEGGTVKICTYDSATHYVIEIIDDGMGFDYDATEMHVGLENVRNRLAGMCKGVLSVKSTVGVGTRVTVEIPKRKGKRK